MLQDRIQLLNTNNQPVYTKEISKAARYDEVEEEE
jgi:hypothetical protein